MSRFFAWGCLLVVATACGAGTSVSTAQPGPLPVEEWCAQYHQVIAGAGLDQGPPAVPGPAFVAMMEKLDDLAEQAPSEIRDDLRAIWTSPEEAPMATATSIPPVPDNAGELMAKQLERPMRWITDHCGDDLYPEVQAAGDLPTTDFAQPQGDWQAVQRGTLGDFKWAFFRTQASERGVCVSFEAEPSHIDWQARIRAQAPPGIPLPPVPPPVVQPGIGAGYKGKLAQCGPAPDLFERSDPVVFWVQDQDATNRFNVLAGLVVDSARSLTVTFTEGGEQVVTPVDGTFVATYDAKLHVARVVPDLGPDSKVTCEPLPDGGLPAGMPDVFALTCQGSTNRMGLPIPPLGLPKR